MLALAQPTHARTPRTVAPTSLALLTLLALLLAIAPRPLHPAFPAPAPAVPAPRAALPRAVPQAATTRKHLRVPIGIRAGIDLFLQAQAGRRYWLQRAPASAAGAIAAAWTPGQQLSTRFAAGGLVTVRDAHDERVRMRLDALDGQRLPTRAGSVARTTLTYRHGALAEWWRNGPLGLEQGFTLPGAALAPRGQATVRIAIAASTAIGRAGQGLRLGDLQFGNVVAWDARGKLLPVHAIWRPAPGGHAGAYSLAVSTRGARFPITIDPTLSISATQGDAYTSGQTVAMSGDGNYLAVSTISFAGNNDSAVLLFQHPAAGWASAATALVNPAGVVTSSGFTTDQFGEAIALNRDGSVLLVGAPGAKNNSGAADVYVEPSGGWGQGIGPATLTLYDPQTYSNTQSAPGDEFGAAVALDASGSVAAISAYGSNIYTGFVYVYQPAGGVATSSAWSASTAITTPVTFSDPYTANIPQGRAYGLSLALSANGNALLVGAPQVEGEYGQAYLYLRAQQPWIDGATVSAPTVTFLDPANQVKPYGDYFAQAVALSGDGTTVLIGAYGQPGLYGNPGTSYPSQGGAAYLFAQPAGGWASTQSVSTPTTTFTDPDNAVGDGFGGVVALNGPGTAAVIGALGAAGGEGKVDLFAQPLGGWSPGAVDGAPAVTYADPNPSSTPDGSPPVDAFGLAAALTGDLGVGGALDELTTTEGNAQTYLTGDTFPLSLQTGWNMISPPLLQPDATLDLRASAMVRQVYARIAATTSVTPTVSIYAMVNGSWSSPVMDTNGTPSGSDFFLQPGVGDLAYSSAAVTVAVAGALSTYSSAVTLPMGWDTIGMAQLASGQTVMASTEVNNLYSQVKANGGNLVALYAQTNGAWSPYLMDSNGTITSSAGDFPLAPGAGYLVYVAAQANHTYTPIRPPTPPPYPPRP